MEFLEVQNTVTKIENLKHRFYSSLDKAEDLISEIFKTGHKKILGVGHK